MGAKLLDLGLRRTGSAGRIWDGELRAAHVEGIKEGLAMKERCVINVERDFADDREGVFPIFEIVDPNVLRDQAAHGIEGEAAHGGFDATLVEFLDDALPPLLAEPAFGQIPAAPGEEKDNADDSEAEDSVGEGTVRFGAATVELARERRWSRFQD
jgi:hypothetical protein